MPRGVWNDRTPGKRSAAAKKSAKGRIRQVKRRKLSEAEQLHAFLHEGGPPLAAPERGGAVDCVLSGPQLGELLARIRAATERDAAA
jgi:hypothetical protein